jgi:S1-C subfamily serine protease
MLSFAATLSNLEFLWCLKTLTRSALDYCCWLLAKWQQFVGLTLPGQLLHALSASDARSTFERTHNAIYQIRVMDTAANNKTSTGSGFVINNDGLVATNYHVVSSAVNTPNKYRVELLQNDESTVHAATVVNVDVVNDLAVLKVDNLAASPLALAEAASQQGDTCICHRLSL